MKEATQRASIHGVGRPAASAHQPMTIACLLFDLDGTLVDSKADLVASVNLMLGDFGREGLPGEDVARMVGEGATKLVGRALAASLGRTATAAEVTSGLAAFRLHYAAHLLDATRPYPSVHMTLSHFRDVPKAVVTNKPLEFTEVILNGLGLRRHFTAVLGGECLPERKPSAAPLVEALRRCGFTGPRDECLMVGDSAVDIASGKAAGVRTCGFTGGFRSREELADAGADYLIGDISELVGLAAGLR